MSPSDDVAEMHKVMCESNWPDKRDKRNRCENVLIQARITRRMRKCYPVSE